MRVINSSDYARLLELDKKVYPTDEPVTPEILDTWYARNPEFGMMFDNGMCVAIPLTKDGWNKLISGDLAEADLDSNTIFDSSRDTEMGIHIYHIEKFDSEANFHLKSLAGLQKILTNLRQDNSELSVAGFSGLCVTSSGINLFYNKLNCRERSFINSEHILSKDNQIKILDTKKNSEIEELVSQGYMYENRCKMLVSYPEEISPVWKYLTKL